MYSVGEPRMTEHDVADAPTIDQDKSDNPSPEIEAKDGSRELTSGDSPNLGPVAAADLVAGLAKAAVNEAKAEAAAAQSGMQKPLDQDARR